MIKASEAKRITLDIKKQAKELVDSAHRAIVDRAGERVLEAAKRGDLQVDISVKEFSELNQVNLEASRTLVLFLVSTFEIAGYRFDTITNAQRTVTLYWDRV